MKHVTMMQAAYMRKQCITQKKIKYEGRKGVFLTDMPTHTSCKLHASEANIHKLKVKNYMV